MLFLETIYILSVVVAGAAHQGSTGRQMPPPPPPVRVEQREVVKATTSSTAGLDKLSPYLRAAVIADATFAGLTEKGRGVLQTNATTTVAAMTEKIAKAGGAVALLSSRLVPTSEVLITYTGSSPGAIAIDGVQLVPRPPNGKNIVVRAARGLTPAVLRALAALSWATNIEPFVTPPQSTGDWSGTLHAGMMAIGGETTGIVIQTAQGRFELQPATEAMRKEIEALDGKEVVVTGTLTTKAGVEVARRQIIQVTKIVKK